MSEQKQKKELTIFDTLQQKESSLNVLVNQFKEKLLKQAADNIKNANQSKQEQFLARIILNIAQNKNLTECFNTPLGRVSIYIIINRCMRTGLELDSHAYAVPYNEKINGKWIKIAKFQIKKEGFRVRLCGGDKPILKNILCRIIHEKEIDNVDIDLATGEVKHKAYNGEDPGKIIGVWVQLTHLDGRKEAEKFPIKYIYDIRNKYSRTYQKWLKKEVDKCAWTESLMSEKKMIEKTAIKSVCNELEKCKDALADMLYFDDDNEPFQDNKKENIVDIADAVIDDAIDRLDTEIINKPEKIEEKEPEKKENKKKKSLF